MGERVGLWPEGQEKVTGRWIGLDVPSWRVRACIGEGCLEGQTEVPDGLLWNEPNALEATGDAQ